MAIVTKSTDRRLVMLMLCSEISKWGDLEMPDDLIEIAKKNGFWNCEKENPTLYKKIFNEK